MHQGSEGGSFRDHQRHRAKEKNPPSVDARGGSFNRRTCRGKICVQMRPHSERGEYLKNPIAGQQVFLLGYISFTDQ